MREWTHRGSGTMRATGRRRAGGCGGVRQEVSSREEREGREGRGTHFGTMGMMANGHVKGDRLQGAYAHVRIASH